MAGLALPSDAFRLGDLTVAPSLNRIVHADGTATDLEPRVMRVLAVLAETPGEVVSRAALVDAVWADAVVNEEALTRAVSELRKALREGAPGAIETIRGTGYRLTLPVRPLAPDDADTPEAPAPRKRQRGGALVVLALTLAGASLMVALWAAWPRVASESAATPEATGLAPASGEGTEEAPFRLDSTSEYYRPGLSEMGVYYDSTEGAYFRFVEPGE